MVNSVDHASITSSGLQNVERAVEGKCSLGLIRKEMDLPVMVKCNLSGSNQERVSLSLFRR